jgi:hypothetical protein
VAVLCQNICTNTATDVIHIATEISDVRSSDFALWRSGRRTLHPGVRPMLCFATFKVLTAVFSGLGSSKMRRFLAE